jgi:CBS domain-containing protein
MTTAREIMTPEPRTCSADARMNDVARLMWDHDIGIVPVTDGDGRVIGTITDRDVAMAAYTQGKALAEIEVRSAMSTPVQAVRPQTPVDQVERLLTQHQIRRVPVVDENGHAVGMIGLGDLARRVSNGTKGAVTPADLVATVHAVTTPRGQDVMDAD